MDSIELGYLKDLRLFFKQYPAKTYLVAVSGGLDSMLLCKLMLQLQLPIEVMHVNYGLRGEESEKDQAHVQAFCEQNQIPLHLKRCKLQQLLTEQGGNLQAEARRSRYAFFEEIRNQKEGCFICTAHHADDQIETFWLQLARGAGMKGLAGMMNNNQYVLRPFLQLSRDQIFSIAKTWQIAYRQDSSNSNTKYRRNLWRNVLIPFLSKQLPQIKSSVQVIQKQFQQEIETQQNKLEQAKQQFQKTKSIGLIEISQLSSYQFVELFKSAQVPPHITTRISDLFKAENGKYLTWKDATNHSSLFLVKNQNRIQLFHSEVIDWDFEILPIPCYTKNAIDQTKIIGAPFFRMAHADDKIKVMGMNGSKRVMQIFKETGIPLPLRTQQLVLCDEEKILAIPGILINKLILAKPDDTKLWTLNMHKKP